MATSDSRIAENLARVRARIAEAAQSAGRSPEEVRLVGVTKYVGLAEIRALLAAGCTELGESRPQALAERATALAGEPIAWHLIGHLQRNKVARVLPYVRLIHSVDSMRLAEEIDRRATGPAAVLLEINVSGEPAKHGFAPDQVEPLLLELAAYPNLHIRGLMTMASLEGGQSAAAEQFASLRELRDKLSRVAPPNIQLKELSMGMSGDFEVAIREGATIVRVGSALFE